ncbi:MULTISPECIES: hypothetical protein [Pseudomonas]|uniref:hypothetical protein n=1 Tax=Pseudomonas TaxID=286 RepID=UPI00226E8817|nr:hypothetical protein [Pseudomonas putida]WAB97289.1 hypothetical protein OSW16_22565 [Pseudomonas putida]
MKKLVPDPPDSCPIHYITIIADLSLEDAKAHAAALMDSLSSTIELYLSTVGEDQRRVVLDNMGILTDLLRALFSHMTTLEREHE